MHTNKNTAGAGVHVVFNYGGRRVGDTQPKRHVSGSYEMPCANLQSAIRSRQRSNQRMYVQAWQW